MMIIKAAFKAAFLYMILSFATGCSEDPRTPQSQEKQDFLTYSPEESKEKETAKIEEDAEPSLSVMLSSNYQHEKTIAQTNFDCDQKIFAVILLKNYPEKTHNITINWIDPYEKQRESTEIPTYVSKNTVYTWSSLSLHRDATAGMLQWVNPAAGMEEFIGEWRVNVVIDGKLVEYKKFTVVC